MNKKLLLLVLSVVCVGWVSAQESYKYLSLDMKRMEDVRSTEAGRNERTGWIKRADEQLKKGPYSVTYKKVLPPSGDKHDYISMGPYWWPNPKRPTACLMSVGMESAIRKGISIRMPANCRK